MQKQGGQRTWTAMIYLNDVAEGGATWFPTAGIRVAPRAGSSTSCGPLPAPS